MRAEMASAPAYLVYTQPVRPKRHAGVPLYATQAEVISIPREYADYADVFSEDGAASLPDHTRVEHAIPIQEGKEVPYGPLYPLSREELQVLREYLETNMAKGWIRSSNNNLN
jgi:hypothetical protein